MLQRWQLALRWEEVGFCLRSTQPTRLYPTNEFTGQMSSRRQAA